MCLEECCLISKHLGIFQLALCFWFLLQFHCGLKAHIVRLLFFWICSGVFHIPEYDLPGEWSPWAWEECVHCSLLLHERVYRCSLYPVDWWWLSSAISLLVFRLLGHFWWGDVEVSNSNSEIIYFSFQFYWFWLMYFDALLLGTYVLKSMSSWRIDPYHYVMFLFIPGNFLALNPLSWGLHLPVSVPLPHYIIVSILISFLSWSPLWHSFSVSNFPYLPSTIPHSQNLSYFLLHSISRDISIVPYLSGF